MPIRSAVTWGTFRLAFTLHPFLAVFCADTRHSDGKCIRPGRQPKIIVRCDTNSSSSQIPTLMQRITPLPPKVDDGARQGSADACYTPLESYEGLPLHRQT